MNARPFVETSDGVRLFVQDWGAGRPMLFIHGWALSSDAWQYNVADFGGSGFRCVAFDRRGHGRSEQPSRGYALERLADDVATVLDALDLRDVTLVAHSLGGTEAVAYLARHGAARVSRLVLLAPGTPMLASAPDNEHGLDPALLSAVRAEWRQDFSRWVDDGADAFFRPGALGVSRGIIDWTARQVASTSLQVALQCGLVLAGADLRAAMRAIDLPTLVIHGDADASIPVQFGRLSAQLVPGAKYLEYAGAPHGLYFTHRARIHADVCSWMGIDATTERA